MSKTLDFYIQNAVNSNKPDEECITLHATKHISLNGYALLDSTFDAEGKSNIHRHVFLFPDVTIDAGDTVKVFTGIGDTDSIKNANGTYTHLLYMNSKECIWNDKKQDTAILWRYAEIDRRAVPMK